MAARKCRKEKHSVRQPKNEGHDLASSGRQAQIVSRLRRHPAGCADVCVQCECGGGTCSPHHLLEETKGCCNPYSDRSRQEPVCSKRGGAFDLEADQAQRNYKRCRPVSCHLGIKCRGGQSISLEKAWMFGARHRSCRHASA